jgi:transcriptional regulator with XRE-family HTH domain
MSDVLKIATVRQIKAARALLAWEQKDLAKASGLGLATVQRMEKMGLERSTVANAQKLLSAFEAAGIEFTTADNGGVGVRLHRNEG